MWERKGCAVCRTDFAVHPKAKTFQTRQLCSSCRSRYKEVENDFAEIIKPKFWRMIGDTC